MGEPALQQIFELGLQHHRAGRLHDAEMIYRQILSKEPKHEGAMHHLGIIAHHVGRNDAAEKLIRRVIEMNPLSPEAYNNLGAVLRSQGKLDEAIAEHRHAIGLRAEYASAYVNLGLALAEKGVSVPSTTVAETPVTLTVNGNPVRYDLSSLYHYTNEAGMNGIVDSGELRPSLWYEGTKDVRYGNGQYLSDTAPGTRTPSQLSYDFLGQPFQGQRFTNFVQVDVSGLRVIEGRPGVFVVPNNVPLDVSGRILNYGKVPTP